MIIAELTQEIVRELLDYRPETGDLFWRERTSKWFTPSFHSAETQMKRWNKMFAGKKAFTAKNGKGHCQGSILGTFTKAHRLIWLYMTGELPEQIDHENGVPDDNRWVNLRNVTNQENQRNVSKRHDNSSGFTGVHWHKRDENWSACIHHEGRNLYLGSFDLIEDAIAARIAANIKYGYHPNHGRLKHHRPIATNV